MKTLSCLMLPVLFMITPACIIVDDDHHHCVGDDCYVDLGNIEFFWDFELGFSGEVGLCYESEVAAVDVYIYDEWGDLEFRALDRPCEDTGAIIDNFYPGTYDIQLVGVCRSGAVTHEGWWTVDVYSGVNDFDYLTLSYLGPCS